MSILQTFIQDFLNIIEVSSCTENDDFRNRVQKGLLLLFNKPERRRYYEQHLLFRDYHEQALEKNELNFSNEAFFYVDKVLFMRRLQLANNLIDKPSNAHWVLARLCALNVDPRWRNAVIMRYPEPNFIDTTFASFRHTANALAEQVQRATDNYSAVAQRRELEFGAFYLTLKNSGAKVPAELSLEAIFSSCPLPLMNQFTEDSEFKTRFGRTVEHLNERYGLLRSCGLKPQLWLDKDVSDEQLRDLKKLRELAKQTEAWVIGRMTAAYHEVFGLVPEHLRLLKELRKLDKEFKNGLVFEAEEYNVFYNEVSERLKKHIHDISILPLLLTSTLPKIDAQHEKTYSYILGLITKTSKQKLTKTVAKFDNFEEWQSSEVGRAMLGYELIVRASSVGQLDGEHKISDDDSMDFNEIDDATDAGKNDSATHKSVKENHSYNEKNEPEEPDEDFEELTEENIESMSGSYDEKDFDDPQLHHTPTFSPLVELLPNIFSPVMAYFFSHFLDKEGWRLLIEDDCQFVAMLKTDPQYSSLQGEKLCNALLAGAIELAEKNAKHFAKVQLSSRRGEPPKGNNFK